MSSHDVEPVAQRTALGHVDVPGDDLGPYDLVSHEVRTPLTILLAGAEILEQHLAAHDDHELAAIAAAMTRAARRIDRVLDGLASAIEPHGRRELGRLGDAVSWIRDDLTATRRLRLVNEIDRSMANTHVPIDAVSCILAAVIDNALKFSADDQPVTITGERQCTSVIIRVADRGQTAPGGPLGDEVFAPFRQADMRAVREAEGMGLGLFTARRAAREIGGDVSLTQTAAGTVVSIRLPVDVKLPSATA